MRFRTSQAYPTPALTKIEHLTLRNQILSIKRGKQALLFVVSRLRETRTAFFKEVPAIAFVFC